MKDKILQTLATIQVDKKFAVGNDLVFIPTFQNSLTDVFKNKVYTANEIAYCNLFDEPLVRYASTWAAKEAVYKAIKQISKAALSWKNIEIIREKIAGQPNVILHQNSNLYNISLTITHDNEYVWALAFIELKPIN